MKIVLRLLCVCVPFLTFSQNASRESISRYLKAHAVEFGLSSSDTEFRINSTASSQEKETQHVYVSQLVNGIPVVNGTARFTLQHGEVSGSSVKFVPGANALVNVTQPGIGATEALERTLEQLGLHSTEAPTVRLQEDGSYLADKGDVALENIPIRVGYYLQDKSLKLVWEMSIYETSAEHWWSIRTDAVSGEILWINDWVLHCDFSQCAEERASSGHPAGVSDPVQAKSTDAYTVFAIPTESPTFGLRTLVTDPSNDLASPFGWHDTDGTTGAEYTYTRGNNVYTYEDINDDDLPGQSAEGGSTLSFNFAFGTTQTASENLDAALTNLFYMNNIMHDVYYQYGFDEQSGNFQFNNYGNGGIAQDEVMAEAQDGSGTNNANFATPPDGQNPRMQMYLWYESSNPDLLTVNSPSGISGSYETTLAAWGAQPSSPVTQDLVLITDNSGDLNDGCETITNGVQLSGKIAVVKRGNCTFVEKAQAAEAQGAIGLIIINNVSGGPISMGGSGSVNIPVVMISQSDGQQILNELNGGNTVNATIEGAGSIIANDSDFDNGVIGHEFTHGISNRLTGGALDSDCLSNAEQMGEGWSDWFALMLTIQPGATAGSPRGVATYLINEPTNGTGIRNAPYSTSFGVNNYTYAATNNASSVSQPHGIGFVWCTMLWDLNWAFIDEYGYDPDVYDGTGGNNMVMALVVEALKLQPCEPGFVDGRDAILEADELLYDGEHACMIWKVFAKRGLGFSADQGSSNSRSDQTEAFDLPVFCTLGVQDLEADDIVIYPNPVQDELTISTANLTDLQELRVRDMQGRVLFESGPAAGDLVISMQDFSQGVYLVEFDFGTKVLSRKVVKH